MNYIILLLFLICNSFFGSFQIKGIYTTVLLFCFIPYGIKYHSIYKNSFKLLLIGFILMLCSSYYFRQQSPLDSIRAMPAFFGILFYFFLKGKKTDLKTTENTLIFLIWIFDILYILQYILIGYGINFLSIDDWMLSDEEGGNRLRVMSSGLYSLGLFYGLVNFYNTRKLKYLPIFLLGVLIMFLAGYRQLFASLAVAVVIMLYKFKKLLSIKTLLFIVLLIFIFNAMMYIPDVQEKINGMFDRASEGATLDNKDYIRVVQFTFFENEFFHNIWERIFGAGIPFEYSSYGRWWSRYTDMGIQYVDWGLIGTSWMLGTITVLGMIHYSCKAIFAKVDQHYMYIGLWFIFLLASSITNWEFCRNGNFLVQALALYIVELASNNYKENHEKNSILSRQSRK